MKRSQHLVRSASRYKPMAEIIEGLEAHAESNKCPVWPAKNQGLKGQVVPRSWFADGSLGV
jgi:hypothetical protein